MTDNSKKIEWYKEVLELEPNSKVFFPLARMLAEAGNVEEAIKILQAGLVRHEEFLEARLFLIELLYKSGMRELCDLQVEKLNTMFSEYAGFWQAWAACLSTVQGDEDAASALNFLAAHFICGKVSLHEVINRGLATILDSVPQSPAKSEMPEICAAEVLPAPSANQEPVSSATERNSSVSGQYVDRSGPQPDEQAQTMEETAFGNEEQTGVEGKNENPVSRRGADESASWDTNPNDSEDALIKNFSKVEAVAQMEDTAHQAQPQGSADADAEDCLATVSGDHDLADGIADAELILDRQDHPMDSDNEIAEEGEEHFSLRTRSMAEVLAEQGDFNGALDIYHELHAAAISLEEKEELEKCISMLESKIIAAQELELAPAPQEFDEPGSGQDKLISMLEALAERVEARAQE